MFIGRFFASSPLVSVMVASLALAASPPRYALEPGRQLTYEMRSAAEGEGGHGYSAVTEAWVIAANDDGSFRVILKQTSSYGPGQQRTSVGWIDLFPDGRHAENTTLGPTLRPGTIFPPLPKNAGMAEWNHVTQDGLVLQRFEAAGGDEDARYTFRLREEGPLSEVYQTRNESDYVFDRERGFVERVETRTVQEWGIKRTSRANTELKALEQHDADWVAQFNKEINAYLDAERVAFRERLAEAQRDNENAPALVAEVQAMWTRLRDETTLPEVQQLVDAKGRELAGFSDYIVSKAGEQARVLGRPAPAFDTTDLQGRPHTLEQYRGSVVVLDFWYRGCGWCIYAMPQIKQVADHFAGRPVAVLGMNTDRNEADALLVERALGLNYPSLKAIGIPEQYGVRGFPTLIIIDQQGVLRDIHVGYSPVLREQVVKSVEALLAE